MRGSTDTCAGTTAPVETLVSRTVVVVTPVTASLVVAVTLRPRRTSVARAADLSFGNQTERILEGRVREQRLRALVGRLAARLPEQVQADAEVASLLAEAGHEPPLTLVRIGYRAARDEAGPGKLFDFSAATLADRWAAGGEAMQRALGRLQLPAAATTLAEGLLLHEVEARSGKA